MNGDIEFVSAVPVLASLDIQRSVDFFATKLGFTIHYASQGEYGIVSRDSVNIHFWGCSDPQIPAATGCRVSVRHIESLYDHCAQQDIVHPNGLLHTTPWGNRSLRSSTQTRTW